MQLATLRSAAEIWEFIDAETERRKQQTESAAGEQKGSKTLPTKPSWAARPWQCLVSLSMLHSFTVLYQAALAAMCLTADGAKACNIANL